eukprot:gb/GECH01013661.1/.p1 GENE.gb/GECH01013661.1/~~gb/GECH01013661.1/.p1  ORF type:complete len:227 (+),score=29.48 gb/GECH01013661.1/:1-681(+)
MFSFLNKNKAKTVRPKKEYREGTSLHKLHKIKNKTLGQSFLENAVKLPEGHDKNAWLAVNTIDFFNTTNLLYGSITEFCTNSTCPTMTAGRYEFYWADGVKVKRPIKVSAPEYVNYLLEWVEHYLEDDKVFPSDPSTPFPKNFETIVRNIFRRLFRVYAHIYHSHLKVMEELGQDAHLNTVFKHLCYFILEFNLIGRKELLPMKAFIIDLGIRDQEFFNSHGNSKH